MLSQTSGFICVIGAILAFGSFAVPLKSKRVQAANIDPVVFQLYYSLAIFASSWLLLTYNDFTFTTWGLVGASLWVPASILSIFAIKFLSLSVGQGVWSGTTVVVNFMWGTLHFGDEAKNLPLALLGIGSILVGIFGLALCKTNPSSSSAAEVVYDQDAETTPLSGNNDGFSNKTQIVTSSSSSSSSKKLIGFACAIALGILNGSMMVPARLDGSNSIVYVISFAIGVVAVTPVIAVFYFGFKREVPKLHLKVAFWPGITTGLLWSIGNFCSTYAVQSAIPFSVAFSLTQVALLVAGLWGVLIFKEMSGKQTLIQFFASAAILLGGSALLAVYG